MVSVDVKHHVYLDSVVRFTLSDYKLQSVYGLNSCNIQAYSFRCKPCQNFPTSVLEESVFYVAIRTANSNLVKRDVAIPRPPAHPITPALKSATTRVNALKFTLNIYVPLAGSYFVQSIFYFIFEGTVTNASTFKMLLM